MRCKQGDLAIIGYIPPERRGHIHTGKIIACVRHVSLHGVDAWATHPPLEDPEGSAEPLVCEDYLLTPIRPQPDNAEDEMIRMLGSPNEQLVRVR